MFRAYAHRGGTEVAPENSLAAFAHAHDLGIRFLETDVRASRDGVAVVQHDATLDRTTDRSGRIRDMPWAEVRRARIGGEHPILRLDELLDAFPDATFNLDVKEGAAVAPILDALLRTHSHGRVCLTSFSHGRLAAVRRRMPAGTPTSASPREVTRLYVSSRLGSRVRLGSRIRGFGESDASYSRAEAGWRLQIPEFIGGRRLLDERFLAAARARRLPVDVWTVNDPLDMRRLLSWGVDGIMTDRPGALLQVMADMGR